MNPKRKGGAFERVVAKALSLWVSRNQHDDLLWRSATSGGRATVASQKGKRVKTGMGDIVAVERHREANILINDFIIECKNVKNLRWDALLYGTPTSGQTILPFWKKLLEESTRHNKSPMLIAKQNGADPVVCIQRKVKHLSPLLVCYRFENPIFIYDLEDLCTGVTFSAFCRL
jgi:hypothetical protein